LSSPDFYFGGKMTAISSLRMARLQKGLTLDDLFLRSKGKLSPARLSRIERGLCSASPEETASLVKILGVEEKTVANGVCATGELELSQVQTTAEV
jgi:transcriptional regulator with XRE-family HTH domain